MENLTAKEYLIELFGDDYSHIIGQDENRLAGIIKQYAKDACKEQREICDKLNQCPECSGGDIFLNAPEPELK